MRVAKSILKKTVVLILLIQIILSCIGAGSSYAYTKEEVASAIGGLAAHVVDTYGKNGKNIVSYDSGSKRQNNPFWKSSQYSWNSSEIWFDCASFALGCYKYGAGMSLTCGACPAMKDFGCNLKEYFEEIPWNNDTSILQTGDLIVFSNPNTWVNGVKQVNGHAFIFVNSSKGYANNGKYWSDTQGYLEKCKKSGNDNWHVYRVSDAGAAKVTNLIQDYATELEGGEGGGNGTSGSITTLNVKYSEFYFNGVPDGRYSLGERLNIFQILINAIKELLNFLVGLLTYLFRGLIISFISVFDRLLNNTIQSMNGSPVGLEESGTSATSADDPISMNRSVSIEQIVFNDIDLFDIDIFKVDTTTEAATE